MTSRQVPERELVIAGDVWHAYEAWRAASGLGLVYFVREGGPPEKDRRASIDPGDAVETLDETSLRALFDRAVGLTATEDRFVDGEGRVWLLQGVGPTWATEGSAAEAVGVRFRCISERRPLIELRGARPGELSHDERVRRVEAAGVEPEAPGPEPEPTS